MKEQNKKRQWGYTVRKWFLFNHYHVTLFPDGPRDEFFDPDTDLTGHVKFNTQEEAKRFVVKLRRKLARHGVKLHLHEKDVAM